MQGPEIPEFSYSSASAFCAKAKTASFVAAPPMNPEACMKIHPGIPLALESSSSRRPRHCSGNAKAVSAHTAYFELCSLTFTTGKRLFLLWHGLDTPIAGRIRIQHIEHGRRHIELLLELEEVLFPGHESVKHDNSAARVVLRPVEHGRLDKVASRQPGISVIPDLVGEGVANKPASFAELDHFFLWGDLLIPPSSSSAKGACPNGGMCYGLYDETKENIEIVSLNRGFTSGGYALIPLSLASTGSMNSCIN